jgi:RNA polymerase sigma factor (sigma-70 family)
LILIQVWKEKQYAFRAMVRAVLLDKSSIDDVLQEAFTRVLQSRKSFTDRREAFHYLRKTVLSTTIDLYRKSTRYSNRITYHRDQNQPDRAAPLAEAGPLELLLREEEATRQRHLINHVRAVLRTLPTPQQQAIELFFGREGKRLKDVCREAGIPYSTLRSRMIRGVDNLRLRLKEEGVDGTGEERRIRLQAGQAR